jgi:hypothetical protein
MTNEEFTNIVTELRVKQDELILKKGHDYTVGNQDRLFNFKWVAGIVGITPEQCALVYMLKHVLAIATSVKFGHTASDEPLEGRFLDATNYLLLLKGIIDERANEIPSGNRTDKNRIKPMEKLPF